MFSDQVRKTEVAVLWYVGAGGDDVISTWSDVVCVSVQWLGHVDEEAVRRLVGVLA